MKRILIAAVSAFLLLFSACGGETDTVPTPEAPSPDVTAASEPAAQEEPMGLPQMFPYIDGCTGVYVNAGYTSREFFGGQVYVRAGQEPAGEITALLGSLDMTGFSGYSGEVMGASVSLKLENENGAGYLAIINGGDGLYLTLSSDEEPERIILKGPEDALDFTALSGLSNAVLSAADDPELCAGVRPLDGSEEPCFINAADTAKLVNILDGTADSTEPAGTENFSPGFEITFGQVRYCIDKSTGVFSREAGDDTEYYQLAQNWLAHVLTVTGAGTGQ